MAIAADSTAEQAPDAVPHKPPQESRGSPGQPDHGETNEVDFEEEDGDAEELDGPAAYEERERAVLRRLYGEPVGIEGNFKTLDELIEAEVADLLRSAGTVQDLVRASTLASALLLRLDVFESVCITLDAGPHELPGTANVLIQVVEAGTFGGFGFAYYSRAQVNNL
jgi:outer membrane protein insertion porin family